MAIRKAKWQNDYIEKTYDRINLTVYLGNKDVIKHAAELTGESVNGFINRVIGVEVERLGLTYIKEPQKNTTGDGSGISTPPTDSNTV